MRNLIFFLNKGFVNTFFIILSLLIFFNTQALAKIYINFNDCIEKNISTIKSENNAKALIYLCERLFIQTIKEINEDEIKQNILLVSKLINFMKIEMEKIK
jgi:hypothetical protein